MVKTDYENYHPSAVPKLKRKVRGGKSLREKACLLAQSAFLKDAAKSEYSNVVKGGSK